MDPPEIPAPIVAAVPRRFAVIESLCQIGGNGKIEAHASHENLAKQRHPAALSAKGSPGALSVALGGTPEKSRACPSYLACRGMMRAGRAPY
jgi:hypothetical protein